MKLSMILEDFYVTLMQLHASMVTLDWLVGQVLTVDVWRSVSSTCGGLFAVITGHTKMPEWFADNWDTQEAVSTLTLNSSLPMCTTTDVGSEEFIHYYIYI